MEWADMDLFINFFKETALFCGTAPDPDSMQEAYQNFLLMLGSSLTNFAANPRHTTRWKFSNSQKTRPPLSNLPRVMNVLWGPYIEREPLDGTTREIETYLYDHYAREKRQDAAGASGPERDPNVQPANLEPNTLKSSEFAERLLFELTNHQAWLRFDWLEFHTRCRTFLVALRSRIPSEILGDHEDRREKQTVEDGMVLVCQDVLGAAAENEWAEVLTRGKKGTKGSKDALKASDHVIALTKDVLDAFVKKEGSAVRTEWVRDLGNSQWALSTVERFTEI